MQSSLLDMLTQQQMGTRRLWGPGHRHCYLGHSYADMQCACKGSWEAHTDSLNNFQNDLEVAVLHKDALAVAVEGGLELFVHYCLVEMQGCHQVLMLTSCVSHSGHRNRFQYVRRSECRRGV